MDQRVCHRVATILLSLCVTLIATAGTPKVSVVATWPDGGPGASSALTQGLDGNFYGVTQGGAFGTIFKATLSGAITTLYKFCSQPKCADGYWPFAGLTLGSDGNFYGTAYQGGAYASGTIFKVTPEGQLTILHSFQPLPDGGLPVGNLVQSADGSFYGTTQAGGAHGRGTIFRITSTGALTVLYSFCPQSPCTDGTEANGGLIQAPDGNFYGTTSHGGLVRPYGECGSVNGCGVIFSMTPTGAYTVLHGFQDRSIPLAGVTAAADGYLYGTTKIGGAYNFGSIFKANTQGEFRTLFSFDDMPGAQPWVALVEGNDGNFYGTTYYNISGGTSTLFQITPAGALTTLYTFRKAGDQDPTGLVQGTDGSFYGSTNPVIFRLSVGLPPLVKTVPLAGHVGSTVMILGTSLTSATGVSFNKTPASFTVISPAEITATVPAGATTGKVQVATPSGILSTVGGFVVAP